MQKFTLLLILGLVGLIGCARVGLTTESKQKASGTPESGATNSPASAKKSERGTPDEAKEMLARAIEHYKTVGREQALADFNGRKPPFYDRDLYVACIGANHRLVANGGYPTMVGLSTDSWRDADGKALGKAAMEATAQTGEGAVEYRWLNPVSNKPEKKIGYFQKAGEDICGVGAYQPN